MTNKNENVSLLDLIAYESELALRAANYSVDIEDELMQEYRLVKATINHLENIYNNE